jgi:tetratricopeptide (TPR) repeat protein
VRPFVKYFVGFLLLVFVSACGFSHKLKSEHSVAEAMAAARLAIQQADGEALMLATSDLLSLPDPKGATSDKLYQLANEISLKATSQKMLQEALVRHPGNVAVVLLHGLVAEMAEDKVTAERAYAHVKQVLPDASVLDPPLIDATEDPVQKAALIAAVLKRKPDFAFVHYLNAEFLLQNGSLDQAYAELMTIVSLDPEIPGLFRKLYWVLKSLGRDTDIVAALTKQAQLPDVVLPHYLLGKFYGGSKADDAAIAELEVASESAFSNSAVLMALAEAYGAAGRADEAFAVFAILLMQDPGNAAARLSKAQLHEALKEYDEAFAEYQEAVKLDATNFDYLLEKGDLFLSDAKMKKARTAYQMALDINPNSGKAHWHMGKWQQEQGGFEKALQAYEEAINLEPTFEAAYYSAAEVLDLLNREAEGLRVMAAACRVFPKNATLLLGQGILLSQNQQYDEAEFVYRRAKELDPKRVMVSYNLGVLLAKQKKFSEAAKAFSDEMVLSPFDASPLIAKASVQVQAGDYFGAEKTALVLLALDPAAADAYTMVGYALDKQGKAEDALQAYAKALALNPGDVTAQNNIGDIFERLGDFKRALENYHKAVSLDPSFALGYQGIGSVMEKQGRSSQARASYRKAVSIWEHKLKAEPGYLDENPEEKSYYDQLKHLLDKRRN